MLVVVRLCPASAVFMPEADLLSAVPGEAEAEVLLPRLPAGLFCCATAAAMLAVSKPAASRSERDLSDISASFLRGRRRNIPGGDTARTQHGCFGSVFRGAASRRINRRIVLPPENR